MKRFLMLWLVGAFVAAVGLGSFNVPRLYPLVQRGVKTLGTVTAFDPNNHQTVHYAFEVNGRTFSGSQEGGVDGQATTTSAKHDVFFLPDNPNISCIGNPRPMLWNEVITISLAMLFFVPFLLLLVRMRSLGFRRWLITERVR